MKRIGSVFLLLIALTGTRAHGQEPPKASRIGYADMEYVFNKLPEARQIDVELKSMEGQLKNQLDIKAAEIKKKYDAFIANEKTMLVPVRENAQRELELLHENREKFKHEAQASFQKKQSQLLEPVYQKMNKAIEIVAIENNLDMVLNAGTSSADILYINKTLNISDLVLKKLAAGE